MATENSADPGEPQEAEAPARAVRRTRDYSQRPQKPIKLKPAITREQPGPVTRLGPPREQLAVTTAPPVAPVPPVPAALAEPQTAAAPPPPPTPLLPEEVQRKVAAAARAAGLPTEEWVARATRLSAKPEERPVSYDEVVVYTLREMNQRLAGLEMRATGPVAGSVWAWIEGLLARLRRRRG